MKNFGKTSIEKVNGVITFDAPLLSRSVVTIDVKGNVYVVAAKCRNTDMYSVLRAYAKAIFAAKAETLKANEIPEAVVAQKRVADPVARSLSGYMIGVTDKNGRLITKSVIDVRGKGHENLRTIFRATKGQPLYKLVVEQGKAWDDELVCYHLDMWVKATIAQMSYVQDLDAALGAAAESTYKEACDKIKAEREAAKAEREKAVAAA